ARRRRTLPAVGVLRRAGSPAGQVRDAPPRRGGPRGGERRGSGLRLAAPVLLRGAGSGGPRRARRAPAPQARAAARGAHAPAGRDGLPRQPAGGGPLALPRGTRAAGEEPLWRRRASAQHRTRAATAEKNTAVISCPIPRRRRIAGGPHRGLRRAARCRARPGYRRGARDRPFPSLAATTGGIRPRGAWLLPRFRGVPNMDSRGVALNIIKKTGKIDRRSARGGTLT